MSTSIDDVVKLKQEKKDLEDDIKTLKIMAFKLKSDMVFASANAGGQCEDTNNANTNIYSQRKKSVLLSLPSQIHVGNKNFTRMTAKETEHVTDNNENIPSDNYNQTISNKDVMDWSAYDTKDKYNIIRYYTKEGPEPIVTDSMKKAEENAHMAEANEDAIRRSSETASTTIELFNKNLKLFKSQLKQGYSCYIWEGDKVIKIPVVMKLDTKNDNILFEQSELLFGIFSKHVIPTLAIADIYEILPGADINEEDLVSASNKTVVVNTMNDNTNPHNNMDTTIMSMPPMMTLANSNITTSIKATNKKADMSCLLSIVSKSDEDIDSRRLAFQFPSTEDRNALLTGIR